MPGGSCLVTIQRFYCVKCAGLSGDIRGVFFQVHEALALIPRKD
ncbi:hypothetical protein HMPREF0578_0449 [Mobiluncus mulieris 28-1]|uniref:Uncharacterized protein n=1 Tax=Mobiluncus mulieris ATCC 35239 TaxID=871571 RepID=E0QTC0_9ACTO|nr:hypothetical protein HMPREF0577_1498 [Mobiluncus mulieris ATCC 35243]EEZ91411.1 hypothetical protein HMPREF0578_0449 [Mobiluncus mulieris 28-1]EFM45246.1 hypothetical protein HMPREF0580_2135 [Mobiluncus mulieris ATCC 35239]EFN93984.1 hypothetical protein HMPREF9278_0782 [Mobiluncus mulieris FB024-16]